ncbi:hypothetical protein [Agromyces sp. NPDC060279]|uniref:hypothetical protein n=1 Tax=Agromyces sp. NPDC060279 TaxID=3347092 RepID=UPI0036698682
MGSALASGRGARRRVRWWAGLLVLGLPAAGASAATPATPAQAADPFAGGERYALQGVVSNSTRYFLHVDPDAETSVQDGAVAGPANRQLNALGISADGTTAFYVRQTGGGVEAVYIYNRLTGAPTSYHMPAGVRGESTTEAAMTTGLTPRRTEPGGTSIRALGKEHHASTT